MEKKVGRIILFFALFFLSIIQAADSSIVLSILDIDNKPIQQAMVSSQFILQVSLNNIDTLKNISFVEGMQKFKYFSVGRSSHVSMQNGKTVSKIIYKFVMQSDVKGAYDVGPIKITDKNGEIFHSNELSIVVDDKFITSHTNTKVAKYIATSSFDKKTVYVGEKVTLSVDFLDSTGLDQYSLALPEFDNLIITNIQQNPQSKLQHNNGQEYIDTQWVIDVYPKSIEFSVVEGLKIKYVDSRIDNNFFGRAFFVGGFASMLNFEQELNIRPTELQVLELPKMQGFENVVAVGNFSDIAISINKNSMEQGQGIVLTAKIIGDGNFEMIDSFPLLLPDDCECYDSGSPQFDKKRTYKSFEYVIQAQSAGEYHIPNQLFHYFDPIQNQYKILKSNSIDFLVTPSENEQNSQDLKDQELLDEEHLEQRNLLRSIDYSIEEQGTLQQKNQMIIPISYYNTLLNLLYFIFICMMIYFFFIQEYIVKNTKIRHFFIFLKAKRACDLAAKNGNSTILYSIFINLFIQLRIFTAGRIHHEQIEQYLKNKGFSDLFIKEWKIFYNKISQASFTRLHHKKDFQLLQEALIWLQRLKE